MRTPECERTEQGKHSANDACIEEETNSHLRRELSGECEVEKPTEHRVNDEVTDDGERSYSLNTLGVDGHGVSSGLTTQAQRRRPQGAPLATVVRSRRSLQRMVRPLGVHVS